jgi:hypothetical protein
MDIRRAPKIPGKSSECFPITKENVELEVLYISGDA